MANINETDIDLNQIDKVLSRNENDEWGLTTSEYMKHAEKFGQMPSDNSLLKWAIGKAPWNDIKKFVKFLASKDRGF